MTSNDWIQLVFISPCSRCLAKPLGWYMARVYRRRTLLRHGPRVRLAGARHLSHLRASIRKEEMGWRKYAVAVLLFNAVGFLAVYALLRLQGVLPLNPQGFRGQLARPGVQHRGQLRHEHQLAKLRRRDDDELPVADARAHGAELCLGGVRHGRAGRADSRLDAAHARRRSATSGSTSSGRRFTSCCRCRSSSGASPGLARRHSELQAV